MQTEENCISLVHGKLFEKETFSYVQVVLI